MKRYKLCDKVLIIVNKKIIKAQIFRISTTEEVVDYLSHQIVKQKNVKYDLFYKEDDEYKEFSTTEVFDDVASIKDYLVRIALNEYQIF